MHAPPPPPNDSLPLTRREKKRNYREEHRTHADLKQRALSASSLAGSCFFYGCLCSALGTSARPGQATHLAGVEKAAREDASTASTLGRKQKADAILVQQRRLAQTEKAAGDLRAEIVSSPLEEGKRNNLLDLLAAPRGAREAAKRGATPHCALRTARRPDWNKRTGTNAIPILLGQKLQSLEGRDQNKLLRLLEKLVGCTDPQETKAVINEAWEKIAEIENFVEGAGASHRPPPPDSDSDEEE